MHKQNSKQAEETFNRSMDDSMKWFQETTSIMADAYNKQLHLGADIYKKWLATFSDGEDGHLKDIHLFKKNTEQFSELFKEMVKTSMDFSTKHADSSHHEPTVDLTEKIVVAITEVFNKQTKLTVEFNEKYFAVVNNQFKHSEIDFNAFSNKFQKVVQNNTELSEESIKAILATYRTHADSSPEANEKLLGEINKLIDFVTKNTLVFWEEMLETISVSTTKDAAKKGKKGRAKQKAS